MSTEWKKFEDAQIIPQGYAQPVAEVNYTGYEPSNHLDWLNGNSLQRLSDGTKLYIHSDAVEVERTKRELALCWEDRRKDREEIRILRAQLAERDALLRECKERLSKVRYVGLHKRIDAALSATAEPAVVSQQSEGE